MPVITDERPRLGDILPPPSPPRGGNGDNPFGRPEPFPISSSQLLLWLFMTGIVMLFAGLSSAYIVLRGVPQWESIVMPSVLWINTLILVASSATIEFAKRAIRDHAAGSMKSWLALTTLLGVAFLFGQLVAWQQLRSAGVYLPTNLHSGFFYVLTGAHGLHLLGGVIALGYVFRQALLNRYTPGQHESLKLAATYWHFLDGLWVYLVLMFLLA